VSEGEDARCTGFFATGGGFLDIELLVEVERRRSLFVAVGMVEGPRFIEGLEPSREVCDRFLVNDATALGWKAGGSLRVPFGVWRGFGGGGVDEAARESLGATRDTVTQSGSSL
jgi:hypothetical protein